MEDLLNVVLSDGTIVKTPHQSYVLQAWYNGKWNNEGVYPPTDEGFDRAQNRLDIIARTNDNVRIQKFM